MYVEKIEIPAFRVLRDVVLEFGGPYDPQIFPLGSENGGGKSTLLQLVFILLHCSAEPARHPYLRNLLESGFYSGDNEERMIARLAVRIGEESHALEFLSLHGRFLSKKLDDPPRLKFETDSGLEERILWLPQFEQKSERLERLAERFPNSMVEKKIPQHEISELRRVLGDVVDHLSTVHELRSYLGSELARLQEKVGVLKAELKDLRADSERVKGILVALNYHCITTYQCATPNGLETCALICRVPGQSVSKAEELLRAVASKVFLLGPSNQQYLFLGKDTRKALLGTAQPRSRHSRPEKRTPRPQIEYLTMLDRAESAMPGFYAYDWLSVEPLVQLFADARDKDFKQVVKTGNYGDTYTKLIREVNTLLLGKKVRPLEDLSGVEFLVTDEHGHETPLSPEDLSQGELKRLMIYAWLRANHAHDALVLIDEIEASFHPDWQVGIVRDLQDWAPKNQYILATHSYELCQALTPRHVRELQPRLLHGEAAVAEAKGSDSRDG